MSTKQTEITKAGLCRLLSIADKQDRLEYVLKALPNVGLSAVKSSAYFRIGKANVLLREASLMREEAIVEFIDQLTERGNGWTKEEVFAAIEEGSK
jgi:hypothetical protein